MFILKINDVLYSNPAEISAVVNAISTWVFEGPKEDQMPLDEFIRINLPTDTETYISVSKDENNVVVKMIC